MVLDELLLLEGTLLALDKAIAELDTAVKELLDSAIKELLEKILDDEPGELASKDGPPLQATSAPNVKPSALALSSANASLGLFRFIFLSPVWDIQNFVDDF